MLAPRRPNLSAAIVDLAFAGGAAALGAMGVGWIALLGIVVLHLLVWGMTRRAGLRRIERAALPRTAAISVLLIGGVDACAFLIGSWFRTGA